MVEICLIICCVVIVLKFKKAGEKGAFKYILGVALSLVVFVGIGILLFAAVLNFSSVEYPGIIIASMMLGYIVAIAIAIKGIKKGNMLLSNTAVTRAAKTGREL